MFGLLSDDTLKAVVRELQEARDRAWLANPLEAKMLEDAKTELYRRKVTRHNATGGQYRASKED